ncbi:hypothetical protein KJ359_005461 [Pestalotiopsis sp. 9143b]|nr:hypothetical protein KJ359_005461 [Pestalotiopsis sp. 9143b]
MPSQLLEQAKKDAQAAVSNPGHPAPTSGHASAVPSTLTALGHRRGVRHPQATKAMFEEMAVHAAKEYIYPIPPPMQWADIRPVEHKLQKMVNCSLYRVQDTRGSPGPRFGIRAYRPGPQRHLEYKALTLEADIYARRFYLVLLTWVTTALKT